MGNARRTVNGPICVLGAGNMGSGIAQSCAQAGFDVRVRDLTDAMLARGQASVERTLDGGIARKKLTPAKKAEVLSRLKFTTDAGDAVRGAGLVIEAVFEEEAVKRQVFDEIAGFVGPEALVATNTSSLSVSKLAEGFPQPERFAGLHFFYPASINKLLEVVGGARTDPQTIEALTRFGYRLRKIPIRVQDVAGFAVNRFFVPYLNEAARMLGEGVAAIGTIEAAGRGFTGASLGPFELMNVTGTAISFHSMQSLEAAFGPAYAPAIRMEEQFRAQAPWDWKSGAVDESALGRVRTRFEGLVYGIAARLVEEGVATAEAVEIGAEVGLRWPRGPFSLMGRTGLPQAAECVREYATAFGPAFPVSRELTERATKGELAWPLHYVRTERRGPVAWVLLDRPQVLNSLSATLLRQLEGAFVGLHHDASIRCVVLAGASPVFSAGADVGEMAEKTPLEGHDFGFVGQAACRAIERCPAPVIAFVEGYALGGGLEIALACDFVVASEETKIGLPEVSVGIHPGMGGATRLTRLVGAARAKYLVFLGAPVSAAEAERLGIVVRTYPADRARDEVQALADSIAGHAPLAVAWVKEVIDRGQDAPLASALKLEGESAARTFLTKDRDEGMQAFLKRRRPSFEGR